MICRVFAAAIRRRGLAACVLAAGAAMLAAPARADTPPAAADGPLALHAQATFTLQGTPGFAAPYAGPNSLKPRDVRETFDATLYAGVRPWRGAELWINPEIDQGFGLSGTLGVAGFPSGEAYKVGKANPYLKLQRLFARQTIALGGAAQPVAAAANQFGGTQRANRLVLWAGKFGVADVFDTNRIAHDPRADFLNWALIDTGSFDYAANAWGYSIGAAAEWYQGEWTVRGGAFNLSKVPNGEALETGFGQHQLLGEIEHRHTLGGHTGAVRLTVLRNHGRFGRFADALALAAATGSAPDTAKVRRPMSRAGVSLNAEQDVSASLSLFARAGAIDGAIEPYDFSDIDRTFAVGGALRGAGWGRDGDTAGLALATNRISAAHRRYLAAGGLGVLVGDGRLPHPGGEWIAESYYLWHVLPRLDATLDYQLIVNPAYNRDRGPAHVLGARLHWAM